MAYRQDGDGPDPYEPADPYDPPAPGGTVYTIVGYDAEGHDIYSGPDGALYTGDPNGMNGMKPYTGDPNQTFTPSPPPTPPHPGGDGPTPPPTGTGGGTQPPGSLGTFVPPPTHPMPDLPQFHPPTYTPPPAFEDPTMGEVENDPGYAFARDEQQKVVERSKAASGVFNTGGTLKDLIAWGGNFASQRYGDVRNRKKDNYMTNYQTQYIDPYHLAYTSALDQFNPQMTGYQNETAWNQHANDMDWQHAFDLWNREHDNAYQYYTT